ncbi:hypothetical protein GOBAR_DD21809 [Gossypium barbadense]|nr:hypothetical protein GOBAR_DD21809 [Gossypium barbadense]
MVGAKKAIEKAAMVNASDRGSNKKMNGAIRNTNGLKWDNIMVMGADNRGSRSRSGCRSGERETNGQRRWR